MIHWQYNYQLQFLKCFILSQLILLFLLILRQLDGSWIKIANQFLRQHLIIDQTSEASYIRVNFLLLVSKIVIISMLVNIIFSVYRYFR